MPDEYRTRGRARSPLGDV